ncbi:MAG: hypothetical protein ACI4PC_10345 [Oscillospiraceae bacterium]
MDEHQIHNHEHEHDTEGHIHHDCDGEGHQHHHHEDGSCCCHKHEVEFHGPNKPLIARIITAAVLYLCGMLLPFGETAAAAFTITAALIAGYDIILAAIRNLFRLRFFDEYFLMTFAAVAACIIGEYEEGAAVLLLYRIGEAFQDFAIRRSRKTISSLTGACEAEGSEKTEKFITRFAGIYTPVVLALAVLIAVCLPLFTDTTISDAVYRALTFLVLACPCAIVISVPLAYFAGIGAASRKGIFFKDSTALDHLAGGETLNTVRSQSEGREITLLTAGESTDSKDAAVVYFGHDEGSLRLAKAISKKTRVIALENIVFTILIKCAVLVMGALGISSLWFAVFADSGVAILAVLNSLRAFRAPAVK